MSGFTGFRKLHARRGGGGSEVFVDSDPLIENIAMEPLVDGQIDREDVESLTSSTNNFKVYFSPNY